MEFSKTQRKINRVSCLLFGIIFVVMILVPFALIDTTPEIASELENRAMTRWPGVDLTGAHNDWYGHYVEDRVAFRNPAIRGYIQAVYGVFHEFAEELHMYGKEEYIFPADDGYIRAYQHLATDEKLIDDLTSYLSRTNKFLQSRDITFVFTVGLDKKTVYPEYFPDSIHVDENNPSIMEMLDEKLEAAKVPHLIPVNEFREQAKKEQIYNVSYDCAHWNDKGALYGLSLVDYMIREKHPEVIPLEKKDFRFKSVGRDIEFISLPIREKVPVCKLRSKEEFPVHMENTGNLHTVSGTTMQEYINENVGNDTSILIVHDSFLEDKVKFFIGRYHNVYMVPRQNYMYMQEYIEALSPDVVLFEVAERAFVDDLYAYTELTTTEYK